MRNTVPSLAMIVTVVAASLTVGVAQAADTDVACRWRPTPLADPPGHSWTGFVASDQRTTAVGSVRGADFDFSPVVWRDGVARVTGDAFGHRTTLWDVNSSGTAVGFYYGPGPVDPSHAVRYHRGRFEKLPELPGSDGSDAYYVNKGGDIAGRSGNDAVVWPADKPGTVRVVSGPGGGVTRLSGIDDDGRIVGYSWVGDVYKPYVWGPDGSVRELQSVAPDAYDTYAAQIRNGRIVGSSGRKAVEWDLTGRIVHTFDVADAGAQSINDDGWVSVQSMNPDGLTKVSIWKGGRRLGVLEDAAGNESSPGLDHKQILDDGSVLGNVDGHSARWRCR